MNPAIVADLVPRFRPFTSAQEEDNAQALLDDAWEILTARLPHLEQNIADGTVTIGNAVRVVCAMVVRVLRNPDGLLEESIDDYRYKRADLLASGELTATAADISSLTPGGSRRTSSVRLVAYGEY